MEGGIIPTVMDSPEISCPLCKQGEKVRLARENDTESPTQNVVDRALLAEASKPVQYTLHALPQGTGFQKGSAQKYSRRSGLPKHSTQDGALALTLLHLLRLLQAVKPESDAPRCLCAKTKAAQTLSLQRQHKLE